MSRIILITGSTDGIGLETAKMLYSLGHQVLIHGRSNAKLKAAMKIISQEPGTGTLEMYRADFSILKEVETLAKEIATKHDKLDVLINNAGLLKTSNPLTQDGLDVRFAVNTIAPYLLTRRLLPLMGPTGRVVNLSSAAQATVNINALADGTSATLSAGSAYAQSKLAITAWSHSMALELQGNGPVVVAVNPASMLGTKMVQAGYGVTGGDIRVGADILVRASISDEFASATGKYYDNDIGRFSSPHSDALNKAKTKKIVQAIEDVIADRI
ncbi:hypothetical protein SARC_06004 [Sphaeroforma arctica JP610]|uniref:Oxidoreductase n=1 Tax=Sphaeroforma arctica JP610 TaxID=667725 RepID=A0A0L0G0E2_9EUKA|nr:hypothetical protein SARC_06004 [Sphaeroforma arctica JP610]KNC81673.1 hypothetical protein SARC_06004 [Sphaeroforma arctica JP610]|eukprot:XP_014155575.1 hypothetical protein SARC_06004 [Sphaeroforma arctica JP610]